MGDQPRLQPMPVPQSMRGEAVIATDPQTGQRRRVGIIHIDSPTGTHTTFWTASAMEELILAIGGILDEVEKPILDLPVIPSNGFDHG